MTVETDPPVLPKSSGRALSSPATTASRVDEMSSQPCYLVSRGLNTDPAIWFPKKNAVPPPAPLLAGRPWFRLDWAEAAGRNGTGQVTLICYREVNS